MTDISIGKSSNSGKIENTPVKEGEYFSLKKQYDLFMEKTSKSDFANSPVLKMKELETLVVLRALAEKEGLTDEVASIEKRISLLNISEQEASKPQQTPYYRDIPIGNYDSLSSQNSIRPNKSQDSEMEIDENSSKIIHSFKDSDVDEYHLSYLLKKCRDEKGEISPDKVEAIEILAAAGVSLSFAAQILDEFSESFDYTTIEEIDGEQKEKTVAKDIVNLEACQKLANYKSMGFQDIEALNFVKLVNGNFQDEDEVNSYINKLRDSKISPEASVQILKNLAINDKEDIIESKTEKSEEVNGYSRKRVIPSAVNSVITLKKSLLKNRNNEVKERNNPINNQGSTIIDMGETYMIMDKDGYIAKIMSSPQSRENIDEDIKELKEKYEQAISDIEDNLLVEFSSKYKEKDGTINSNGLRTITALRRAGVTYNQLLPLTDYCLEDGGINSDKMNAVTSLKKSGCLGADIIDLLESLNKTPDGKYDMEDFQNACDFSSLAVGGKDAAVLIKEIHGNHDMKDFLMAVSPCFNDKSNLIKLIPLIKNEEGIIDENAMNVLYNLAENIYASEEDITDKDFISYANDIIYTAMDKNEILLSDEGAGICSIMCQYKKSPQDIIEGLNVCKDKSGNIDSKLADVLWEMCLLDADINQITTFINSVCKDENGNPNHYMARKMAEYMKQGKPLEEMMKFI